MLSPEPESVGTADFSSTPAGGADGRPRVLLIEPDPVLGFDLADALETAGLVTLGPLRSASEALICLPYLKMDAIVLGQTHLDEVGRTVVQRLRRRAVPVVLHAVPPTGPELAAELGASLS